MCVLKWEEPRTVNLEVTSRYWKEICLPVFYSLVGLQLSNSCGFELQIVLFAIFESFLHQVNPITIFKEARQLSAETSCWSCAVVVIGLDRNCRIETDVSLWLGHNCSAVIFERCLGC